MSYRCDSCNEKEDRNGMCKCDRDKEEDRGDEDRVAVHSKALGSVLNERVKQNEKWGEQNHDPFTYLAVLGEEYGELCQAALQTKYGGPAAAGLREEAVQTAAVALAIVECIDRDKWHWPGHIQPQGDKERIKQKEDEG